MINLAMWLTALVAAEHALIVWVEMFSWERTGPRVFRSLPVTLFAPTKTMAANQGLYNAFLVAGLLWALIAGDALWQLRLACFFLGCVVVAGAYGGMTVGRKIFFVQGLPALLALVAVLVG